MTQLVKVLNLLNNDGEITSKMINEYTEQGWELFNVFLIENSKKHTAICVVLKREI